MDIRNNLKAVIEDKCYSKSAIARRANISPCKLSLVLNRERRLDANELFCLCEAMEMTPTELKDYKSTGRN